MPIRKPRNLEEAVEAARELDAYITDFATHPKADTVRGLLVFLEERLAFQQQHPDEVHPDDPPPDYRPRTNAEAAEERRVLWRTAQLKAAQERLVAVEDRDRHLDAILTAIAVLARSATTTRET